MGGSFIKKYNITITIAESTKEREDVRTFHLPQFSMRGKIITVSAAVLSASALGVVSYQAINPNGQLGASLWNNSSSYTSTSSTTSSSVTSSSSSTGGTCGGSNGQCGGTCEFEGDTCQWIVSEWSANLNHCGCAEGSSSSSSSRRTSSMSNTSSSVCSSNPGAIRPNCPTGAEVPGSCDPSTCQSDWFNGMCLYGGICATVKGGCSDTSQCNDRFRPCGAEGANSCDGYCPEPGDQCESVQLSTGESTCACRSWRSGFSSSY